VTLVPAGSVSTHPVLAGRVAVVTGAGSGIGRSVAEVLAGAGATVACADRDEAAADATVDRIVDAGGAGWAAHVDVADRAQVVALVDGAVDRFGRIDVMCNIAGISSSSLVTRDDGDRLSSMIDVTIKGAFHGCEAAARHMTARGRGSIVNMSSTAIDVPTPGLAAYSSCKAAVAMLTKVLAVEVGRYGVRANAVAPGFTRTPMTVRPDGDGDGAPGRAVRSIDEMAEQTALKRIGEPPDVAATFLYLASDASSFVTGQTIRVNGGASMPW
jgi:3-oxoacyl-[acyl-carrier protein] reductase